jgi:hypothetical protein
MVGAEDCRASIGLLARDSGASIDTALEGSLAAYTGLLEDVLKTGRHRVIVAAVPPPRGPASSEDGPLEEVAKLTARYNAHLREWCRANRCQFLDYESDVVDAGSGLPRADFQLEEAPVFNLDSYPFAAIVATHLRELGFT